MQSPQSHVLPSVLGLGVGEDVLGGGDTAGESGTGDGGVGGVGVGGDVGDSSSGGGSEAARLISKVESSPVSPSIPRKISGAASSSAGGGDVEAAGAAAADLFLAITAARWLTLDAARVAFATFLGCASVAFALFWLGAAFSAAFTAGGATVAGSLACLAG